MGEGTLRCASGAPGAGQDMRTHMQSAVVAPLLIMYRAPSPSRLSLTKLPAKMSPLANVSLPGPCLLSFCQRPARGAACR